MPKLINADDLLNSVPNVRKVTEFDEAGYDVSYLAVPVEVIKNAPSVDAVEVVRCKDCKHWGTGYGGETEHVKVCEFANYMVGENGYCVYGERREEDDA